MIDRWLDPINPAHPSLHPSASSIHQQLIHHAAAILGRLSWEQSNSDMSRDSPSRSPPPKRRRMTVAKKDDFLNKVAEDQCKDDDAQDEEWVKKQIHGNKLYIKTCKGAILALQKKEAAPVEPLRRGIRNLDTTPDIWICAALAHITDKPRTIFDNWTPSVLRDYWIWIMGGQKTLKFKKGLMPDVWLDWCKGWYQSCGSMMDDFPYDDGEPDMDCRDGTYALMVGEDADDDEDPVAKFIQRKTDMQIAPLPADFHIPESQLGDAWHIKDNYNLHDACLENKRKRKMQFCSAFFEERPLASKMFEL